MLTVDEKRLTPTAFHYLLYSSPHGVIVRQDFCSYILTVTLGRFFISKWWKLKRFCTLHLQAAERTVDQGQVRKEWVWVHRETGTVFCRHVNTDTRLCCCTSSIHFYLFWLKHPTPQKEQNMQTSDSPVYECTSTELHSIKLRHNRLRLLSPAFRVHSGPTSKVGAGCILTADI